MIYPGSIPPRTAWNERAADTYEKQLTIAHFGTLAADRSLCPILKALSIFFQKFPQARTQIRIHVYGSGYDKNTVETVRQTGLADILVPHGRVEHDKESGLSGREQIFQNINRSDVLLALHGTNEMCPEYIPSKLYDYFWTNRPILGLTTRNLELDDMLKARHAYVCNTLDIGSIVQQIDEVYWDWRNGALRQTVYQPVSPEAAVDVILNRLSPKPLKTA